MKYSLPFLSAVLAACTLCASDSKQLRTALFTSNLEISDRMYDYFLAAPGAIRTGKPVVPQGIIAFVERRDRWKQFLGQMPAKPDFLEIRTEMTISHRPDFSFHPRELNRSVDAAVAAGIDRIQISPVFAATLKSFMDNAFGTGTVAEMTDSSGIVLGKAFETTVFYSYCDPNARKAMERIVRDTVNHFQQDPRGRYIVGWNFKYMTNSDWLYPAASGFYDYSTPALAAYRKFLLQKYGNITALNLAYDSAFSSFFVLLPRKTRR